MAEPPPLPSSPPQPLSEQQQQHPLQDTPPSGDMIAPPFSAPVSPPDDIVCLPSSSEEAFSAPVPQQVPQTATAQQPVSIDSDEVCNFSTTSILLFAYSPLKTATLALTSLHNPLTSCWDWVWAKKIPTKSTRLR